MSQQFRLLLKAVALGRYLLNKNRLDELSVATKNFMNGKNSVVDVAKVVFPHPSLSFQEPIKRNRCRRKIILSLGCICAFGFVTYEYRQHQSYVPITNRKQFVVIPRSKELIYQEAIIDAIRKRYLENDSPFVKESNPDYQFIQQIVHRLVDACIYFSPEIEEYLKQLKVVLVDTDNFNASFYMGSVLVIHTGLIRHYESLKEEDPSINVEECIAGVIAHELSHSLSRHSVEELLRWTSWAYLIYITFIPDLVFMPMIKGLFDKRTSRDQELEADFQALYLLKRSGYDPSSMIKTLSLIPEEVDDFEIVSIVKEQVEDHPRLCTRVQHLQDRIFSFERDFNNRYTVYTETVEPQDSFFSSLLSSFIHFGFLAVC